MYQIRFKNEKHYPLSWETEVNNVPYFVGELSEIGQISDLPRIASFKPGDIIKVKFESNDARNGKSIDFQYVKTDYYGSGEDREIGGWRFKAVKGHTVYCELLIIND